MFPVMANELGEVLKINVLLLKVELKVSPAAPTGKCVPSALIWNMVKLRATNNHQVKWESLHARLFPINATGPVKP